MKMNKLKKGELKSIRGRGKKICADNTLRFDYHIIACLYHIIGHVL